MLAQAESVWGLEPGAEVTTEANPDSVTPESLKILADAGFHPGLLRHAIGRAARAEGAGPNA